jgi:hypothetical protein
MGIRAEEVPCILIGPLIVRRSEALHVPFSVAFALLLSLARFLCFFVCSSSRNETRIILILPHLVTEPLYLRRRADYNNLFALPGQA